MHSLTLKRYDAEIGWYDKHADTRRRVSGFLRFFATLLGVISVLFINIQAFDQELAKNGIKGIEITAIAFGTGIIAAGFMLMDQMFQVTERYGRWRVMEYDIRLLRSTFDIEFWNKFGNFNEENITLDLFIDARNFARASFQEVENAIKIETESWQKNMEENLKNLQKRIDKNIEDAKNRPTTLPPVNNESKETMSKNSDS